MQNTLCEELRRIESVHNIDNAINQIARNYNKNPNSSNIPDMMRIRSTYSKILKAEKANAIASYNQNMVVLMAVMSNASIYDMMVEAFTPKESNSEIDSQVFIETKEAFAHLLPINDGIFYKGVANDAKYLDTQISKVRNYIIHKQLFFSYK